MKLSFTTGGWPYSLEECMNLAREMQYDGLEISAGSLDIFERSGAPLSSARLHETARALNEASLSISAVQAEENWTAEEAMALIALAHDLRAPFVVLPLTAPAPDAEAALCPLLPVAERAGVALLIPSVGPYADTGVLKTLLDDFASDYLGAVWHVPCAAAKKTPEEIVTDLGAYIRHVYLCDGMIENGEMDPMIIVTPTWNQTGADKFYTEFREKVVPFVEGKYSTYAESTSIEDLQASRYHRAYGGFSMGSVSTWGVLCHNLDIVAYYMPLSGDYRINNWSAQQKADVITKAIQDSGLKKARFPVVLQTYAISSSLMASVLKQ